MGNRLGTDLKFLFYSVIILFVFFPVYSFGLTASPDSLQSDTNKVKKGVNKAGPDFYYRRYQKKNLVSKITDNEGKGFDSLYGTRNMRPILHGVAYRGGANNHFHQTYKRKNQNPLPDDGLTNLCQEGFSHSIYLYKTRFENAMPYTACPCVNNGLNEIHYLQMDYFEKEDLKKIMGLVYNSSINDSIGPIYLHCWNGWHASGFIGAVILKQFCGYNDLEAVRYWDVCTDGANKSPRYESIRNMIRNFEPYPEYTISDELGNSICAEMPEFIENKNLSLTVEHLLIVPETVPVGYSIILNNVRFQPAKTTIIKPELNIDLNNLVNALKTNKDLKVEIGGHTDNVGASSNNLLLSKKRAKYIHDYLIKKGIKASRLTYRGYGSSRPVMTNKYKEGRAANRRIEVTLKYKKKENQNLLVDEKETSGGVKEAPIKYTKKEVITIKEAPTKKNPVTKKLSNEKLILLSKDASKIKDGEKIVCANIQFAAYSSELNEKSKSDLKLIIEAMKKTPLLRVQIEGHTDNTGTPEENKKISEERAKVVWNYIIKNGVKYERVTYKGFGDTLPRYDNNTHEGRVKNRRIEVKVIGKW